jgi:hypothetical protein
VYIGELANRNYPKIFRAKKTSVGIFAGWQIAVTPKFND